MPVVGPFLTGEEIEKLWLQVGGNPKYARIAAAVALAESGGGTHSYNPNGPTKGCPHGSTDYGLWQINSCYSGGTQAQYNPVIAAQTARGESQDGYNWRPWCTAYTDGACGSKGGHYDPTGASPAGEHYAKLPEPAAAQPAPVAQHATSAWELLTRRLATTLPTAIHSAHVTGERYSRLFRR